MNSKKFLSGMLALLVVAAGGIKVGAEMPQTPVKKDWDQCKKIRDKWVIAKYRFQETNQESLKLEADKLRLLGKQVCPKWIDGRKFQDVDGIEWDCDKVEYSFEKLCNNWKRIITPECKRLKVISMYCSDALDDECNKNKEL